MVREILNKGACNKKHDGLIPLIDKQVREKGHPYEQIYHEPDTPFYWLRELGSHWDQDTPDGPAGAHPKTRAYSAKGDKQGLGLSKRSKKRLEAQKMVMLLSSLAHNAVVWTQRWLGASASLLRPYGLMRMVRDAFQVSGFLIIDRSCRIRQIALNRDAPLAPILLSPLRTLLAPVQLSIHQFIFTRSKNRPNNRGKLYDLTLESFMPW